MQKGARTGDRRLYDNDSVRSVSHIGPYLVAMPDIVVRKRNRPISSLAEMTYGSMSNDNNNFTLTFSEYTALRSAHEEDAAILHRSVGGKELVKGVVRDALYVDDFAPLT